jgi:hypothetical protein
MSLPGDSRIAATSSSMLPVASRALPSTSDSFRENTILGSACQSPANSISISPAAGSSPAVSQ